MKRRPIIRHIRYFWHVYHFNKFLDDWASLGFVPSPQQSDLDWLQAIWEGKK